MSRMTRFAAALVLTVLASAGLAMADPVDDAMNVVTGAVASQQEIAQGFADELVSAAGTLAGSTGGSADQLTAALAPLGGAVPDTGDLAAQAQAIAADPASALGDVPARAAELQVEAADCFATYGDMAAAFASEQAGVDAPALWASAYAQCAVAQGYAADPANEVGALLSTFSVPSPPPL